MKTSYRLLLALSSAVILFGVRAIAAEEPAISLGVTTEDGKKLVVATVTSAGKPVENAKVTFSARRTFGALSLGAEVTLDDGTAAVPFPVTLPGDVRGQLRLSAELANRPKDATPVRAEGLFEGGVPFHAALQPTPRALWAPRAPFILLGNIALLVGLVWGAFAYVAFQLFRLRDDPVADPASQFTQPKDTP